MAGWFGKKKRRDAPPPSRPKRWEIAAQWMARARWISHVSDFLGDPTNELAPNPGRELPNRPEFLMLEFGPRVGRPYFTYLTAGLSLVPQLPEGPAPYLEVIAYSDRRDPRVAQLLFMLSHDVASAQSNDFAFKPFDLWRAEVWGLKDFALAPAREAEDLLDFPNLGKRKEDERYLLAATGDLAGQMQLTVVQLVPLTTAQWEFASAQSTRALLDSIGWESQPKSYGWSAMRPVES